MLLPKGSAVWSNLWTYFTDVKQLLSFLRLNEFTGFVRINYRELTHIIIVDKSKVAICLGKDDTGRNYRQITVSEIFAYTTENKNGRIVVSKVLSENIAIYKEIYSRESVVIHRDLSSEFSNVKDYVNKEIKDNFTGYISVEFTTSPRQTGLLLYEEGVLVSAATDKFNLRKGEKNPAILTLLGLYLGEAQQEGVSFNIYKFTDDDM